MAIVLMKIIKCIESDCGIKFVLDDEEERFLREQFGDKYSDPKRCKHCRSKRKKLKLQEQREEYDEEYDDDDLGEPVGKFDPEEPPLRSDAGERKIRRSNPPIGY